MEDCDLLRRCKNESAFVHFIYPADARDALEQLNNSRPMYCKRPITVEMADKSRVGIGLAKSNVCWLYNQRTCTRTPCTRQHVCLFCNGQHPRKQCTEVETHFRRLKDEGFGPRNGLNSPNLSRDSRRGGRPDFGGYKNAEFEITIDDIPIPNANERDIRILFNSCGPITKVKVMRPRKPGMKVRAYMEFNDQETLDKALNMNGTVWNGERISVRRTPPRGPSRRHREDRFNRYGRRGGRDRDRDRYRDGERDRDRYRDRDNGYDRSRPAPAPDRYGPDPNGSGPPSNDGYRDRSEDTDSHRGRSGGRDAIAALRRSTPPTNSEDHGIGGRRDRNHRTRPGLGYNGNVHGDKINKSPMTSSPNLSSLSPTKRDRSDNIKSGGCIQKLESGKIIIQRKYPLDEVCTLFNGVTGCHSRDCDKIHICSLCECEDHSLPKCPRTHTKIGEILMKQIQEETQKPGSAMTKIQLNAKHKPSKKRALENAANSPNGQPIKKKAKMEDRNNLNSTNSPRTKPSKPMEHRVPRIKTLGNVKVNYILFLLDGKVWRRAQVISRAGDLIKVHYLGWDSKFDEKLSVLKNANRLSFSKPARFYSEATINEEVKIKLKSIHGTEDVHKLDVDEVKKLLKSCQLKNDGPEDLLRERLLNVIDEIRILDSRDRDEVTDINMRRIDELYQPVAGGNRNLLSNALSSNAPSNTDAM